LSVCSFNLGAFDFVVWYSCNFIFNFSHYIWNIVEIICDLRFDRYPPLERIFFWFSGSGKQLLGGSFPKLTQLLIPPQICEAAFQSLTGKELQAAIRMQIICGGSSVLGEVFYFWCAHNLRISPTKRLVARGLPPWWIVSFKLVSSYHISDKFLSLLDA
jgi:hypothetical protein